MRIEILEELLPKDIEARSSSVVLIRARTYDFLEQTFLSGGIIISASTDMK